jgi:hypothetical protein
MNNYEFLSFDDLLKSCEVKIINFLYDYSLLDRYSLDVRKVLLYFLVKEFNEKLHNRRLLIYHTHVISDNHELLEHFPKDELNKFFNRICSTIKKITRRVFFISSKKKIPTKENIDYLEGEVIDEIVLLKNEEPDLKKLKEFLHKHKLSEMFKTIH